MGYALFASALFPSEKLPVSSKKRHPALSIMVVNRSRRVCFGRAGCSVIALVSLICSLTVAKAFAVETGRASHPTGILRSPLMKPGGSKSLDTVKSSISKTPRGGGESSSSLPMSKVSFDRSSLWQYNNVILRINLLGFLISMVSSTQVHLDLLGTGAFAVAALPMLLDGGDIPKRVKVSSAAVALWGIKLAGFLFNRVLQKGPDSRLEDVLSTASGTATFWFVSTIWGIACSLPHALGTTSSAPGNKVTLFSGLAMYIAGLLIETIADLQKFAFKNANPEKFCGVGLWSISQHPNYFGNLLLWAGIFVMNAPALIEPVPADASLLKKIMRYRRVVYSLLSPWFMWTLFNGQASGTISNTVELATSKYGADPDYREYVRTVPSIIPNFF